MRALSARMAENGPHRCRYKTSRVRRRPRARRRSTRRTGPGASLPGPLFFQLPADLWPLSCRPLFLEPRTAENEPFAPPALSHSPSSVSQRPGSKAARLSRL